MLCTQALTAALFRLLVPVIIKVLKLCMMQGVEMQPTHVTAFQEAILGGQWAQAQQLLPQLSSDSATLAQAQFWVLRQKYIEALDAGDMAAALHTLRTELAPLHVNQPELRALAGDSAPQDDPG